MYYIEEADKPKFIEKFFKIIKIEENRLILPIKCKESNKLNGKNKSNSNDESTEENNKCNNNEKISKKLAIKTRKILDKGKSNKIVLSKRVHENKVYTNMLYSFGYEIVDGKWLFEAISCNILDYIVSVKGIKKEETKLSVLVNNLTENTLENIKIFAKEYKSLNIITNHIEKFKKIEERIYNEEGIMITITNNKKKSLNSSNIILNIDFPKELLNKYNIYENAIIINVRGNIQINKKRFNGVIINDYEIKLKNSECFELNIDNKYNRKDLYEAEFYKNIPYSEVKKKINKDGIEIDYLLGNNGKIKF